MKDEDRCREAKAFERIDAAFRAGDVVALTAAVDDPAMIPNGPMPLAIGSCLVYGIYHSPLAFIRTLLELGADPNAPANDGFPPLIAALSCTRDEPGASKRTDVDAILRLLLSFGADPNQRGINDYTPLHMAVAERNALAVQLLLDHGADADLRTRIDDCETALEMARAAGAVEIAALLERKGRPLRRRMRSGLVLLSDVAGNGDLVRRQHVYRVRLRMWIAGPVKAGHDEGSRSGRLQPDSDDESARIGLQPDLGVPVRWTMAWGPVGAATLDDNGATLTTEVRIDRRSLVNGLFYGVEGMRVGGVRRLEIAPHLAYGERGVPGVIPPNAALIAEIAVLNERERERSPGGG